ncbi:MAG: DUF411 domain-containing protein [Nanoarchaeota archaeon]|nr:DUF411 domain-containing protein [Nanoarchaeota archaeon]
MKKSYIISAGIIVILAAILLFSKGSSASSFDTINAMDGDIEIYKSLTCGCCDVYSSYVKGKVSPKVNIFDIQDSDKIKKQYGVPSELESCHTTIIGNYFVEGHMPLEAVEKLLKEQPDIKGIAMPGMPMGSPGMPGSKSGDFVIYAVNNDGSYSEFMRI